MAKKNIEGLAIPYGLKSPNKMANADGYYGTYDSLQDALDTVELAIREPGRTVGIKEGGKVVEYWWESTTDLSDEALVPKAFNPDSIEGDKNFTYDQITPSKRWDIFHNLKKKPSVTVTDSAGTVVEGSVVINDGVRLLIEFNAAFTGTAILN